MPAEDFSEGECGDVADRSRENDEANKAVGVARVGEESEMPKHPADINESDNRERHFLQLSVRAIAQNRNEEDERYCEDRHCDKKSVPAGARFITAWVRD